VTKGLQTAWAVLLDRGFLLLAVVIGFVLVHQLLFLLIRRIKALVVRGAGIEHPEVKKRADTLASVLKSTGTVFLAGITIFFILEILGVDVRPLVAGAGIVGVAVGFGAQTLVRDCLGGIFILAEHQIAVGDQVLVAGITGTVEKVQVRSLTLRDHEGRVHYIPNGEIRIVTNLSQGVARFLVDVPVPAGADQALALAALLEAARAFAADPKNRSRLIEPPEVLGFERLGAGQNTIRLAVRALRPDAAVARELRYAALRALAGHGIIAGGTSSDPSEPRSESHTGESAS
jgi:moderate conductance mechanosensitive channel